MTEEIVPGNSSGNRRKQKVKRGGSSAAAAGPVRGNYQHLYPKPLASYQDVVANKRLFAQTLERLHVAMGTKYSVPTVGGKELDLHQLFVEVTVRGGLEQVVMHRRWREITACFNFPSTATNASFVLRKYYLTLIYHYEQIYFFRCEGWNPPTTDAQGYPSFPSLPFEILPKPETQIAGEKQTKRNDEPPMSTGLPLSTDTTVMGVIDGKFEHGYLVTVRVGTTTLKGVLYHSAAKDPSRELPQSRSVPYSSSIAKVSHASQRRKLTKRDPSRPKPNLSGYNFFFQENHPRLKAEDPEHPGRNRRVSKIIGELWSKLPEAEKAVYQEKAAKDKERYNSEMVAYKQSLRSAQSDLGINKAARLPHRRIDPAKLMPVNSDVGMHEVDMQAIDPDDISSDDAWDDGSDSGDDIVDSSSDAKSSQDASDAAAAEARSLAAEPSSERHDFEPRRSPVTGTSDGGDRLDTDEAAAGSKELDL